MTANSVIQTGSANQATKPRRRHELDVLGIIIVLSLVFLHSAAIFSGHALVVNESQSKMVEQLAGLVALFDILWTMPAMMLMAGITIWYSLGKRTVGEFVRERTARLFVPFLTGLVLIFPPQLYYHLKSDPPYQESFIQFLKRFWHVEFSLSAFPAFIKGAPPDGVLENVEYLWFLIYLFVYTLLLLPLLRYLLTPAGRRLVERLAAFFARRWAIFLLALPIGIVEAALTTEFPGGWNRFVWLLPIIYGFVFASDERFDQALVRHRRSALALGLIGFVIYFMGLGILYEVADVDVFTDRDPGSMLVRFIKGLAGWCWVVAVIGIATHWGQRRAQQKQTERMHKPSLTDRVLAYGREARLPFYVLHNLPIILIGYYVVQWNANPLVKYLVISFSTVGTTLLLYDIGVRRTSVTRFLFGMRPKRKPRLEARPVEERRRPTLASVD